MVRIESRLDYVLGPRVWDRLLDLPSGFFRQFGAGDLAERAAGINAIRGVISRAGVSRRSSAPSARSLYLVLMLTYNVQLTLVAILISLVLVGVTTRRQLLAAPLPAERRARQRGKIMSLVLQLIAGVAKVRVCGGREPRLQGLGAAVRALRSGRLRRSAACRARSATFTSAFSVLSSLAIFVTLYMRAERPGRRRPFTTGTFIAFTGAFGAFAGGLQSAERRVAQPARSRCRPSSG